MIYGSVCSGIEAASVAWHPMGWRPAWFAEIANFPSAVLRTHYPHTLNLGDFTCIDPGQHEPIDLLVGGTPCQSFSVAGLRRGLADDRGNLAVEFLSLAGRARPRWLVWENVAGIYSSTSDDAPDHEGDAEGRWEDDCIETHAFACFLAGLQELGYGFAYRTLDAQYFGVPQRRRRVFVVGYLGDWRRAAAVLFERHCLSGHPPPCRKARERTAPTISARTNGGGGIGTDFDCDGGLTVCPTLRSGGNHTGGDRPPGTDVDTVESLVVARCDTAREGQRLDYETETLIARAVKAGEMGHRHDPSTDNYVTHALKADGFDASEDGTGRGSGNRPSARGGDLVAFDCKASGRNGFGDGPVSPTLRAMGHKDGNQNAGGQVAVALPIGTRVDRGGSHREAQGNNLVAQFGVRRLTPRECERLMGFPDDYTLITYRGKPAADGPRYKALGNSMVVPVMRWIGERIDAVESLPLPLPDKRPG